jgi:hypothetical protein
MMTGLSFFVPTLAPAAVPANAPGFARTSSVSLPGGAV